MRLILSANESQSSDAEGRFVFVENATGPVQVLATLRSGRQTSIKLNPRDQAEYGEEITQLTVRDLSGASNTVDIETGFQRYIPKIEGGEVQITGQSADLDVNITGQAGAVQVEFSAPQEVTFPAAQSVNSQEVIPDTLLAGPELTLNGGATIAADPDRVSITLKAPTANTGVVWLSSATGSGIALDPGEKITFETTAAVSLTEATTNDKIQYMEVTR
jgi:hypothetical protein